MTAIPAAAAAPLRKAVGKVQNTGRHREHAEHAPIDKATIFRTGWSTSADAPMPGAAMARATAALALSLHLCRSEHRPYHDHAD